MERVFAKHTINRPADYTAGTTVEHSFNDTKHKLQLHMRARVKSSSNKKSKIWYLLANLKVII